MAEETKTTISKLTVVDLDAVDELMMRNSATIGFLPHAVLEDYLRKESVLGAKAIDGQLVGYLLYGVTLTVFVLFNSAYGRTSGARV